MWFLVALLLPANPTLSRNMAALRYPSLTACMADASRRVDGLARIGMHGRYLCMHHGEPDRELASAAKRQF